MSEIRLTQLDGIDFYYRADTQDWNILNESCGNLYTKFFEVEKDEIWYDIGANIGGFSCYAAKKEAKAVLAFEPVTENLQMLINNVVLNHFEQTILIYPKGITDNGRNIPLFIDRENYGNCSTFRDGLIEHVNVETIPVESLNSYTGKCIKIDTEGYEFEILSKLDLTKVNKIVVEDHYWLYGREKSDQISNMLKDAFPKTAYHEDYMLYAWR